MKHSAIVHKITQLRPLPGADRLQIASVGNYQVIVGIGVKEGDRGVFFDSDLQLDPEFCEKNDLIRRKNEDGSPAGGMFEEHRRVKAIKLRGAKSEGFWCPLTSLAYTGAADGLKEGDQFDELGGHKICNKYMTKATHTQRGRQPKVQRDNRMFAKHIETGQFRREVGLIPDDAVCYLSVKMHGTSFRLGNVLDEEPIKRSPIWSRIAGFIGLPKSRKVWKHLIGSRNVVLEHRDGPGFYGEEKFRQQCVEGISLQKGEVIYGEIVGFTDTGSPIMAPQDTTGLRDNAIKLKYGNSMVYSYGCLPGQCKIFIYRITQVNEDGHSIELSWMQVKKRCRELGLLTVPEVHWPISMMHTTKNELINQVSAETDDANNAPIQSRVDSSHIEEGIVVRWESEHGTGWLKSKSFAFGLLEGYLKDSADYVDTEEAA